MGFLPYETDGSHGFGTQHISDQETKKGSQEISRAGELVVGSCQQMRHECEWTISLSTPSLRLWVFQLDV